MNHLLYKSMKGLRAKFAESEAEEARKRKKADAARAAAAAAGVAAPPEEDEKTCDDEVDWTKVAGKKYTRTQAMFASAHFAVDVMTFLVVNEAASIKYISIDIIFDYMLICNDLLSIIDKLHLHAILSCCPRACEWPPSTSSTPRGKWTALGPHQYSTCCGQPIPYS